MITKRPHILWSQIGICSAPLTPTVNTAADDVSRFQNRAIRPTRRALTRRPAAARLRAANINPRTGLATDYLNHFNEAIMLLEMIPDMPECAEDFLLW